MRAKSRAIGIDNIAGKYRLLFLDIDRKLDNDELHKVMDIILKKCGNVLVLETRKGYHVVSFKLMTLTSWNKLLIELSPYADEDFITFSCLHRYSVLRISEKFSLYDNQPASDRPKKREWIETKEYRAPSGHTQLFYELHKIGFFYANIEDSLSVVRFHFYISGSE